MPETREEEVANEKDIIVREQRETIQVRDIFE